MNTRPTRPVTTRLPAYLSMLTVLVPMLGPLVTPAGGRLLVSGTRLVRVMSLVLA